MNKLFIWLRVEPKGWVFLRFLAVVLGCNLIYAFIAGNILNSLGIHLKERPDIASYLQETPIVFLTLILPIAAMFEEFFFRLPLMFLTKAPPKIILIGAIFLSMTFGYVLHGGWQQILMQGFFGLVFCLVFLKCGGLQEKPVKAFLSSSFAHLTLNWSLCAFVLFDLTHA